MIAYQLEVLAVTVPAAIGQRHHAHTGLDQAASQEQVIVRRRRSVILKLIRLAVAVTRPHLIAFLAEIQRFDKLARSQHAEGAFRHRIHGLVNAAAVEIGAKAIEAGEQPAAIGQRLDGDAVQRHVSHARTIRLESGIGRDEEAGTAGIGPRYMLCPRRQAGERRYRWIDGTQYLGGDGADAWPAA